MIYITCIPSFVAIRPIERMLQAFKQGNFNYNYPVHIFAISENCNKKCERILGAKDNRRMDKD